MSDISDTARRQLSSLKSGDIEKAYSYTSSDFQKATSLEDYKKYVKHYPILTNYRNASATKLEKTNDNATAFFTLRTTDTNTPVEFRLIKENGQWKILAMEIGKTVAADNALVTVKTSIEFNDKAKDKTTSPISIALPELYKNESNRYSVKYPSDWETEVIGKGSIVFSGKKGSPSYSTGINIQAILTKNTGGLYSTVSEHIDADKKELATQLTNVKFLDQGEVELPQNPKQYKGEYLIFTYMNHGHEYKQMKFFILRDDKQLFYTWSYAAPIEEYNADLPINKAMFESWNIY
ncbi:MAG: DUF4864 domain-containing protein [Gammaproteobacteria bacterium]|nr:DUF4864 domain-containing protein [Gammaproteobacteria bacterium]